MHSRRSSVEGATHDGASEDPYGFDDTDDSAGEGEGASEGRGRGRGKGRGKGTLDGIGKEGVST